MTTKKNFWLDPPYPSTVSQHCQNSSLIMLMFFFSPLIFMLKYFKNHCIFLWETSYFKRDQCLVSLLSIFFFCWNRVKEPGRICLCVHFADPVTITTVAFTEGLLWVRLCAKWFVFLSSFTFYHDPMKYMYVCHPHFIDEEAKALRG